MKKTIIALTTVAVVGLGSAFFGSPVQAETVNELENKQKQIKSERSEIKENLSKADAKIADILFELEELNIDIARVGSALKENQEMLKEATSDVLKTEEEIELLELEIVELEEGIEARFEILKQRVTSYQRTGGNIGYLEVLVGSKNFGEFISRASVVTKITTSDAELMKEQEEDQAKVIEHQEKHEEKLAEQKEMKVELEGMEALILDQQEQNKKSEEKLSKKEAQLTALKTDLEGKDSSLASLEAEIRQSIAAARIPVENTNNRNANNANNTESNNDLTTLASESEKSSTTASSSAPTKPVASGGGLSTAINAGYQYLGTPYRWAGKGPSGFDCSGFVSWAFAEAGYSIPSSTGGLSGTGTKVSYDNIQPGDLVFFNTYKTNGHVGIYIGGGQFIGSQSSKGLSVVTMTSGYWEEKFAGHVRRIN